jgi:hypothetical protein
VAEATAIAEAAALKDKCRKLLLGFIISAECLDVRLACNRGVPSEGTPEAGSRIVKLACRFSAEDLSLTIAEPEMVNLEKPGVLDKDEGCFLGLRRTSGVPLIFSTFLLGVFCTSAVLVV